MSLNKCGLCLKCINAKQRPIQCTACYNFVHFNCSRLEPSDSYLDYICHVCLCSIFPFNHVSDDTEFVSLLLNFFSDFPTFSKHDLNGARLSILNNFSLLEDRDLDADFNLYNNYDIDSKYYLPGAVSSINELKNSSNRFTVLHLNARSLLHKMDHLQTLLQIINLDMDVIAVSETWETSINSDLMNIPGYNKCSQYRNTGELGGGVALLVRKSLDYSPLKLQTKTFESVFLELKTCPTRPTIIAAIYRPPGGSLADFNQEYESVLAELTRKNSKNIILAGDFNINLLNHSSHSETETFLNIMYAHKILPMIKRPTRYGNCCATLIDNIFTNLLAESLISGIILDDVSDHLPIFFASHNRLPVASKYITKRIRCINDATISDLSDKLNNANWSILNDKSPEEAYNVFGDMFDKIYNEALPLKTKKYKLHYNKHKPWITLSILNSIGKKNKMYKKYIITKSQQCKESYLKYKNKLTKVIKAAEKKYYFDKFNLVKDNIRDTWKLINNVLNDTVGTGQKPNVTKIKHNDVIIEDQKIIADKFNDYFVNIGQNLAKNIPNIANKSIKDTLPEPNKYSMFLTPCTADEITNTVKSLKNSKGIGVDGFSTSVIKQIIPFISNPLSTIFNKSFELGIFPQQLKLAKVTPVYKSDEKMLVCNYRPISVLPVFSKILEKLMYTRLENFVIKYKILCENQFGFREKHSTFMALLNIIDHITQRLDSKEFSLGIFIDLSKAFDTIDHNILLKKLEVYGIRGTALNWFKSYLSNRMQSVEINGNVSSMRTITCGVPQGSILGPLLFIIYINDIVRVSSLMEFILFADDTNLLFHDTDLQNLINKANIEVQKISDWLKINKLSLNIKKTHFILFHFRQRKVNVKLDLKIDNYALERVSNTKFLGVIIQENLNWSNHIKTLQNKIYKNLGILRALQHKLPVSILFTLYNTLVYPYLQYCNIAWASQPSQLIENIFILQKKTLRVVCKTHWNAHTTPLFITLKTLKISDINKLQTGCFMYKAMNNQLPSSFTRYFSLNATVHTYFTRQSQNIHALGINTALRKYSIKFFGSSLWNSLPAFIKTKSSIQSFKTAYKQFLLLSYNTA